MNTPIRNFALSVLSVLVSAHASAAAVSQQASPASRVDALFADYTQPNHPGCALGVYRGDTTVYAKGYGLANLEHGVPIDPQQTVFDIGSVSKQFTAASILLLAQDGKLALSDDIRKYLPELPHYGTPAKPITIAHLLHHTSGLRDYTGLMLLSGWNEADYTSDADALAIIARQKALNFATGSRFSYSNTGFFLMSLIVERVSGKPLSQFAQERIFAPLGMQATLYLDDYQRVVPHRATSYEPGADDGFVVHMSDWMQTGDGAVQTTVADLAKWQQNFAAPKVGGRWLIEQLETRGTLDDGSVLGYAGGLFIDEYRGQRTVGHGGAWAGYRASLLRFPSEQLSIAVLCNVGDSQPETLAQQVAEIYLEGKLANAAHTATATPRALVAPDAKFPDVAGVYWSRDSGLVRRLEQHDGKLWYVRGAHSRAELAPTGPGQFDLMGGPVQVKLQLLPAEHGVQKFQLLTSANSPVFEKVQPFAPDAKQLRGFAGTYRSAELDAQWVFAIEGGKLTAKPPRGELQVLDPAFPDAFLGGPMLVRFQRDASGQVVSLLLDVDGMRDLSFERVGD